MKPYFSRDAPGLSAYVCFGRYAGFGLRCDGLCWRLILGWVSVAVMTADVEVLIGHAADVLEERDRAQAEAGEALQ